MFNKLLCKLFGHKPVLHFNSNGVYWCWSSGGYDDVCNRCGHRWEETVEGKEALIRSQAKDPRINPNYIKSLL
jgi:hypothetical protein